ncbi:siderophore-interacting protein [Arenivirga flava]|uniref:Siderophore-interacting protein n=1 Tax=Arenivirga flava TaxID=1930060 RepID=A0AA37UIB0_9MICO|nr:siderophore-interacting protein [Arenivirga flava]GMA29479.1 siderophore-interacting protein [Arenivirga flava]
MLHTGSPNALVTTIVRSAERVTPGFVRLALQGPELRHLPARGLDQRMKLLIPQGAYPAELLAPMLPELEWRRRWRALDAATRPVLRSYTVGEARPHLGELDVDVYVHASPGPASAWALSARPGDRLLLSAPDARRDPRLHGVQWRPGAAERMLLAGDETAYPAIAGILRSLDPTFRVDVVLEAGDRVDAALVEPFLAGAHLDVRMRAPGRPGGAALEGGVADWVREHAADAVALGHRFHAWAATETGRVARIRSLLTDAGIRSDHVHAQGYWNDRARVD